MFHSGVTDFFAFCGCLVVVFVLNKVNFKKKAVREKVERFYFPYFEPFVFLILLTIGAIFWAFIKDLAYQTAALGRVLSISMLFVSLYFLKRDFSEIEKANYFPRNQKQSK